MLSLPSKAAKQRRAALDKAKDLKQQAKKAYDEASAALWKLERELKEKEHKDVCSSIIVGDLTKQPCVYDSRQSCKPNGLNTVLVEIPTAFKVVYPCDDDYPDTDRALFEEPPTAAWFGPKQVKNGYSWYTFHVHETIARAVPRIELKKAVMKQMKAWMKKGVMDKILQRNMSPSDIAETEKGEREEMSSWDSPKTMFVGDDARTRSIFSLVLMRKEG